MALPDSVFSLGRLPLYSPCRSIILLFSPQAYLSSLVFPLPIPGLSVILLCNYGGTPSSNAPGALGISTRFALPCPANHDQTSLSVCDQALVYNMSFLSPVWRHPRSRRQSCAFGEIGSQPVLRSILSRPRSRSHPHTHLNAVSMCSSPRDISFKARDGCLVCGTCGLRPLPTSRVSLVPSHLAPLARAYSIVRHVICYFALVPDYPLLTAAGTLFDQLYHGRILSSSESGTLQMLEVLWTGHRHVGCPLAFFDPCPRLPGRAWRSSCSTLSTPASRFLLLPRLGVPARFQENVAITVSPPPFVTRAPRFTSYVFYRMLAARVSARPTICPLWTLDED